MSEHEATPADVAAVSLEALAAAGDAVAIAMLQTPEHRADEPHEAVEEPLTPIEALERQHGFTFGGDHDSDGAPATLALVCTNLACPSRGQHVQLHADSVLPIHCGGCGGVLHCEHPDTTVAEHHEGTLREPRHVLRTLCTTCGTELDRTERAVAPIAVEDIPLHLLGGVNLDAVARHRQ